MRFAVIGVGRAGGSFLRALEAAGARPSATLGRNDDPATIEPSLDLVIVAVPDRAIAEVAARVPVGPLVVHLSGATGLQPVLAHHERCGSIHPLVSLPDSDTGARALLGGAHLALAAATPEVLVELGSIADLLGAPWFHVGDRDRAAYHAAASIAANHLVGLVAQVERLTSSHGLPLEPFTQMMRAVLDNVDAVGPALALTGPVARGDWDTVRRHLAAIDPSERSLYLEMAAACARLAGVLLPDDLNGADSETS